jgi:hypothetical protein
VVLSINELIGNYFFPKIIDLYFLTTGLDGTQNLLLFRDMVHMNNFCFQKIVEKLEDKT